MIQFRTVCKAVIVSLLLGPPWAGPVGAQTDALRTSPPKLKILEEKAGDRDNLAKRCKDLEGELAKTRSALSNASDQTEWVFPRDGSTRLGELERKALAYDGLVTALTRRDRTIAQLTNDLSQVQIQNANMGSEIAALKVQVEALTNSVVELQTREQSLRSTIEQLLTGNFEYYEVKDGDTIETVAAQPTIYGDASRSEWIRQANWKRVEDIEHLRSHQMLIIPRFPPNGRYEF